MKRILMLLCAFDACVIANKVAAADDHIVYRASADTYSLLGEGQVRTKYCTQTAEGMTARFEEERGKAWIVFVDRDGEVEDTCELVGLPTLLYHQAKLGYPRQAATKVPVARTVKVATK